MRISSFGADWLLRFLSFGNTNFCRSIYSKNYLSGGPIALLIQHQAQLNILQGIMQQAEIMEKDKMLQYLFRKVVPIAQDLFDDVLCASVDGDQEAARDTSNLGVLQTAGDGGNGACSASELTARHDHVILKI